MSRSRNKTVFIHVGYYKTGTTAIQQFCAGNRALLSRYGVAYVDAGRPHGNRVTHSLQPLLVLKKHGFSTPRWFNNRQSNLAKDPDAVLRAMAAEVASSDCETFVISSEEYVQFCELFDAGRQISKVVNAFDGCRVVVIAYLRAPLSYLESWYNQLIRMWAPVAGFGRFVLNQRECHINYEKAISAWGDAVGTSNVLLRRYSRSGAEHIREFLGCLDADVPLYEVARHMARGHSNERLDDRSIELLRVINHIDVGYSYTQSMGQHGLINGNVALENDLAAKCAQINRSLSGLAGRYHFDGALPWRITPEDVRTVEHRINWLRKSPRGDARLRKILFLMGRPLVLLVRIKFFLQARLSDVIAAWRWT